AFYLDQVSGPSALQLHYWVGRRIPLHATSNGKVLLAFAADGVQEEVLSEPLPGFTERTITDPVRLAAELETVRQRGIAIAVDELEIGLTAIAAPISGSHGSVIASVSASGPTFRLSAERLPEVAEEVRAAAAEISRRLGWHGIQQDRAV